MASLRDLLDEVAAALNLARELVDGLSAAGADVDDGLVGRLDEALARVGVGQAEQTSGEELMYAPDEW